MMNMGLINAAVNLVSKINEANYIYEKNDTIRARVERWYNNTEITDVEMLAAVAIHGEYDPALRYNDLVSIKEFYFPTIPFEYTETHIHEIEASLADEMWR